MDVNGTWIKGDYIDELVNNWDSPIKDNSQVRMISENILKNAKTLVWVQSFSNVLWI